MELKYFTETDIQITRIWQSEHYRFQHVKYHTWYRLICMIHALPCYFNSFWKDVGYSPSAHITSFTKGELSDKAGEQNERSKNKIIYNHLDRSMTRYFLHTLNKLSRIAGGSKHDFSPNKALVQLCFALVWKHIIGKLHMIIIRQEEYQSLLKKVATSESWYHTFSYLRLQCWRVNLVHLLWDCTKRYFHHVQLQCDSHISGREASFSFETNPMSAWKSRAYNWILRPDWICSHQWWKKISSLSL